MSASYYRDASCPSQCMAENSYFDVNGDSELSCPAACLSEYASPDAGMSCPSVCNFNSSSAYSTLPNYYNAVKMPASTASRLIPDVSIDSKYQVFNPRINTVNGGIESAQQAAAVIQAAEQAKKEAFRYLRRQGNTMNVSL